MHTFRHARSTARRASRQARALALGLVVGGLTAIGLPAGTLAGSAATATPRDGAGQGSKVAYILEQEADRVSAMQSRRGLAPQAMERQLSNDVVHVESDGTIEVSVWSVEPATQEQRAEVAALGSTIEERVKTGRASLAPSVGLLDAWVPADRLDDLGALPWVAAVTPPSYGIADAGTGSLVSEGVAQHRADKVQDDRGINGNGVTVGVSSNGVSNIATSEAQGELDSGNVTVDDAGSGDEGTAMMEIVADMAPDADLVFDASNGLTDYVNSINNLASKTNVIAVDLAFDSEPAFQEGLGAQTADNIAAAGVSFHSSAGNRGNDHVARVVANGTGQGPDGTSYSSTPPGCANTPDNVVDIDPGAGNAFDMMLGTTGGTSPRGTSFTLQWSEPRSIFPTVGQGGFTDLNLYVMSADLTRCLGQSVGVQGNGSGDTIEQVAMPASMSGTSVKLVVDVQGIAGAVAAPLLDLRWRNTGGNTDTPTLAGSIDPQSNFAGGAEAIAAVNASSGSLESFSGAGPVQLVTTSRCPAASPCPGGAVAGGSASFNQPSWEAADGVTVSGVGGFGSPFFGTSAAAPSSAGCDALLRSAPGFSATSSPATTHARLVATSTGTATPNVTGAGVLDCLAAVNRPPVANPGGPYNTQEGQNIQLNGSGSSDPDTGDSIAAYAWDLDNNGSFETPGATPTFDLVGQDGVSSVRLQVTDEAGATSVQSTTVTIANVAPTVTFAPTSPVQENSPTTVTGTVTDPGWLDEPLTATIDFGDGSGVQPLSGTTSSTPHGLATLSFSVPKTYGDNGGFTIAITGRDDDTSSSTSHGVTVTNVDPTATIDTSGGTVINGHVVLLGQEGTPVALNGRSTDPGSDDLTLTWDFGDGSPTVSHTSLVNPPLTDPPVSPQIKPRDVPDSVSHTFTACARSLTLTSRDDDSGVSLPAHADVVVRGTSTKAMDAGWWKGEFDPVHGHQNYSADRVACYLAVANLLSNVFSEARPASTLADGFQILKPDGSAADRVRVMDQILMTAWLNFANGAIDLGDTVKEGGQVYVFSDVVVLAELQRLDPTVPTKTLDRTRTILDKFNHLKNHGNG
jgi:hypothetical protein